ncbi:MAG: radical SAM protein [Patescibacteria group bacterium]|nr:radical SAM protein [Patescibacteria group bacterium]
MLRKVLKSFIYGFRLKQIINRLKYEFFVKFKPLKCHYNPIWLQIYATNRCTFQCKFCTNHSNDAKDNNVINIGHSDTYGDMSIDTFKNIIYQFNDIMVCSFCGVGEPLLNKDIFRMIEFANENKIITELVTNGSLLSKEINDKLLNSGLKRITISLNESDSIRHADLVGTKKYYFDEIISNIKDLTQKKYLYKNRIEIKISRVLSKKTISLAEEFISLGLDLNVDKVLFHNLIISNIEEFNFEECLFNEDKNIVFFNKLRDKYKNLIKIDFPVLINKDINNISSCCFWHWKNISIDANGFVCGCGRFITPRKDYGYFLDNNVWNNKYFQEMRAKFKNKNLLKCCKTCIENFNNKKYE